VPGDSDAPTTTSSAALSGDPGQFGERVAVGDDELGGDAGMGCGLAWASHLGAQLVGDALCRGGDRSCAAGSHARPARPTLPVTCATTSGARCRRASPPA